MSVLFSSGFGGDQMASMYEQMNPEGVRRKKLAGQRPAPQTMNTPTNPQAPQRGPVKQAPVQQAAPQQAPAAPRQSVTEGAQPRKTFAQMQQEGYARPNPPAPAPAPAQAPAPAGVQMYDGGMPILQQAPAQPMAVQQQAPAQAPMASQTQMLPTASGQGLDIGAELARQYRQGGVSDEVSRGISGAIANPSAYNSDLVKNIYGQLGQNIDDDFAQRETMLREEMAGRGLSDSSIQGGRLRDLNVGRRSAREGLANQLGQMVAQDYAGARDRALGMGMARDQYGNQMGQSYLDRLMGFGQQAFDNDIQQAQFNRMLQNDQDQLMLQMFGLGG